jgi:sugar/nucleoside kinase (ribokinase family)
MFDLLCVGEIVIDFLPGSEPGVYIRNAGGAPANVAIAVARNGLKVGFVGKVGDDDFGRFLTETLSNDEVLVLCKVPSRDAITTMTFVTLSPDGERSFTFARKPGADTLLSVDDISLADVSAATVVHCGSCSLSKEPSADATAFVMRKAAELKKIVSFDMNFREPLWTDPAGAYATIRSVMGYVDLLKISEEELVFVGGESNIRHFMREHGVSVVVETRGASGARCYFRDKCISQRAYDARCVDATGAGDAFWGGFLAQLLVEGVTECGALSPELLSRALKFGAAAGSFAVQQKGAIAGLPRREQVLAMHLF